MSLDAATAWINQTLAKTAAQNDAVALLKEAKVSSRHATLIVAPELTRNCRAYLARWARPASANGLWLRGVFDGLLTTLTAQVQSFLRAARSRI